MTTYQNVLGVERQKHPEVMLAKPIVEYEEHATLNDEPGPDKTALWLPCRRADAEIISANCVHAAKIRQDIATQEVINLKT